MAAPRMQLVATCPECGKKFFGCRSTSGVMSNYQRHLRVHSNERPFECNECEQTFKSHCNLKRHMRNIHRGVEARMQDAVDVQDQPNQGRFQCPDCTKHYASKWSLTQHQRRTHWDENLEAECDDCGQILSSSSKVTRHKRLHCIFRDNVGGGGRAGPEDDSSQDAEDEHAEDSEDDQSLDDEESLNRESSSVVSSTGFSDLEREAEVHVSEEEVEPAATSSSNEQQWWGVDAAIATAESDLELLLGKSVNADRKKQLLKASQRAKRNRDDDPGKIISEEGEDRNGNDIDADHNAAGGEVPKKRLHRRVSHRRHHSALYFCGADATCSATFRHKRNLNAHIKRCHRTPSPLMRPRQGDIAALEQQLRLDELNQDYP